MEGEWQIAGLDGNETNDGSYEMDWRVVERECPGNGGLVSISILPTQAATWP